MSKSPVKRGNPAGMRARQLELEQTLSEHPDLPKVLEKVVRTALDGNQKNQAVAQKLVNGAAVLLTDGLSNTYQKL